MKIYQNYRTPHDGLTALIEKKAEQSFTHYYLNNMLKSYKYSRFLVTYHLQFQYIDGKIRYSIMPKKSNRGIEEVESCT